MSNKTSTPNSSIAGIKNNAKAPNEIPSNKISAPSLNNKSTKSTEIKNKSANSIAKSSANASANASSNNNSILFQTAKEEAGVYEVVSENYLLLLGFSSALIIMIIIFFFSESFRVNRTIDKMLVYQGFQEIKSLDYSKLGNKRLGDFYISSAYNAAHSGYQMYDYTSENIVLALLQSGVRYLEFNIFNSEFGDKAYPVVSMGYKQGEWKMMITDTPLESIFEIIANNAFKISEGKEGVYNPDDPVFIGLNLNTNSNLNCLNLIAFLITKYFPNRLLDNAYSFQNNDNIADIPMIQLTGNNSNGGKIVFFSSDGFQGSGLEEIINYSWDNINNNPNHSMQRLHYSTIMDSSFNNQALIDYNRKGFTIIVPHKEGDFFNENYDPIKAFELGCQFVAMEFQNIDSNMDLYITKFKDFSFIMKNADLQKGKSNKVKASSSQQTTTPQTSIPQSTKSISIPQTTKSKS
jgi:hypothetical protein